MECCICYTQLSSTTSVSFLNSEHCSSAHGLCVSCYIRTERCPLCRFCPFESPDIDGSQLLRHLLNDKHRDNKKICHVKTELNRLTK